MPPWTVEEALIESHPELYHYTNRIGLEGIWKTNSLWATHFSDLSDTSEIVSLIKPLEAALEQRFRRQIIENQHESLKIRRYIKKEGGLDAVARELTRNFVDANYEIAFKGGKVSPMAESFICSFCSHANDHPYEQANGLLSQWRGYGGQGRYSLIFDTRELDALLAREWRSHYWVKLDFAEVVYLDGPKTLEHKFPELLEAATAFMSRMLGKSGKPNDDFVSSFFRAATLLKHRGFREEREVRIVAIPQSERALVERGRTDEFSGRPPVKRAYKIGDSKRHLALFETLNARLPIKKVIVGPGATQKSDYEFALSLVSDGVPISISETPFIG